MEKFSYETNGYNRSEVNQFISDVIRETEGIITKVKNQSNEIEELKKELEHYKKLENALNNAVMKADEAKADITRLANEESDLIIREAKTNASRIVNDALLRAEKLENERETLERNMKIFKRKLKLIIEQQLAVVDEIEILEIEE
ncbi:MAG: DivIVA domain-containing protein [Bacilli bacterium]|nr:DivIVA domain-containing protein [Bacilli bacterium]